MNICHDKQIKSFYLFLLIFSIFSLCLCLALCRYQTDTARRMLLSHDESIVTCLLWHNVPEEVIAMAITNTKSDTTGSDFLAMIGQDIDTEIQFLPFLNRFQKDTIYSMLILLSFLFLLLFGGTYYFLWKREKLIRESVSIIKRYIDGDYTSRLPHTQEGTLYQLFASIDELSAILQSKNETEHKIKEFLKNTISDISHQLKTPLAALFMYQEIMENEPEHSDIIKEFAAKTGTALKRMEHLIQSMLKITRLDAGNILFTKNTCNISELVRYSLEELTTRAERENKKIIYDISDETLVCDPEWTSEAIGNLVKNSLDHTGSGGVIRIFWETSPAVSKITVSDNGSGIAQEDIHYIFKRFYRSKNSKDTQGIGLGLPLVKSIMEGQGGTISVQSAPHEGTSFTLAFVLTKL